jgi:Thrombospondin type 3 repeat
MVSLCPAPPPKERRARGNALVSVACALVSLAAGCGDKSVPTSFYLTVETAPTTPTPDELRLSIYGDRGPLYVNERLPSTGALTPQGPGKLGTVTIYVAPGVRHVRFDARGLIAGAFGGEGTVEADVVAGTQRALTVVLQSVALADGDGDGVPDPIDNCPNRPNADQADADGNGVGDVCDTSYDRDAGADGSADTATVDARAGLDGARDVGGQDVGGQDVGRQDVGRQDLGGQDTGAIPDGGGADRVESVDRPPTVDASPEAQPVDTGTDASSPPDVAPDLRLGGLLAVTSVPDRSSIDLTTEGTIDWAQWGMSNAQSFDHKATGGGKISVLMTQSNPSRYSGSGFTTQLTWSDGTPTASASTATGVFNTGSNAQQSVNVVADNTTRTLRFYGGASNGNIRLTVHLSDGSVPDAIYNASGSGIYEWSAEISFRAASGGQTLTLTWTLSSTAGFPSTVSARGATLF